MDPQDPSLHQYTPLPPVQESPEPRTRAWSTVRGLIWNDTAHTYPDLEEWRKEFVSTLKPEWDAASPNVQGHIYMALTSVLKDVQGQGQDAATLNNIESQFFDQIAEFKAEETAGRLTPTLTRKRLIQKRMSGTIYHKKSRNVGPSWHTVRSTYLKGKEPWLVALRKSLQPEWERLSPQGRLTAWFDILKPELQRFKAEEPHLSAEDVVGKIAAIPAQGSSVPGETRQSTAEGRSEVESPRQFRQEPCPRARSGSHPRSPNEEQQQTGFFDEAFFPNSLARTHRRISERTAQRYGTTRRMWEAGRGW